MVFYLASHERVRSIIAGFNAPVAGTFFAIETVLRPQHAENSPPLTTAMIILAAVIASTVSQVLLGGMPAFTVPPYELQSVAGIKKIVLISPFSSTTFVLPWRSQMGTTTHWVFMI